MAMQRQSRRRLLGIAGALSVSRSPIVGASIGTNRAIAQVGNQPPLSVPYFGQDNEKFCGPACAQMVLGFEQIVGLGQQDLYDDKCHDSEYDTWATTPDGLAATLNNRGLGAVSSIPYGPVVSTENEAISRKICWSLFNDRRPVVVLTIGGGHWIVATGFVPDDPTRQPQGPDDDTYTIDVIDINDPYWVGSSASAGLPPYQTIEYDSWRKDYLFDTVPADDDLVPYRGYHVVIADPAPAGSLTAPQPAIESGQQRTPDQAKQDAVNALYRLPYLDQRDPWMTVRNGLIPFSPLLVDRARFPGDMYYLVPFAPESTDIGAVVPLVVQVSAQTGKFQGAIAVPNGSTYLGDHPELLSYEGVLNRFAKEGLELPDGSQIFYPTNDNLRSTLQWYGSLESPSPFWPFYVFVFPEASTTVLVRLDGTIFVSLHRGAGN
jgi:hypothetical protein